MSNKKMTKTQLSVRTLAYIQTLAKAESMSDDWKSALDKLLVTFRTGFVFDNVAIYMTEQAFQGLEIVYARAMGRGKTAEADAAWGENLANQVFQEANLVIQDSAEGENNRLAQAYFLGLPIYDSSQVIGSMVFIRFGGPVFTKAQILLASILGSWVSSLLKQKIHQQTYQQFVALQQKIQLQDDFLATISHEIRTPLGFIKGYSTTLLRSDTTWDDETRREFLTIIDEEADRLTELIDNLLESAKLQSKSLELHIQPLRLDALIRDVVVRVCTRYKNLVVDLDLEALPPIQGDNVRLAQVFDNLFSNAVKYAPDSPILVTAKKQAGFLEVSFADRGPGIPKDHLPNIFQRFYRVPGENANTGSGLGLYICNQIIMAHHGKIWVESELHQGTTFYIQLSVNTGS